MAIGRLHPKEIVNEGWVFYQKNSQVVPDGNIDFFKNSPPLVLYGRPEVILLNANNLGRRDMFVSDSHSLSGQSYDQWLNEPLRINIGVSYQMIKVSGSSHAEVLDVPGMVIKEIAKQLADIGMAGVGNLTNTSAQTVTEALGALGQTADSTGILEKLKRLAAKDEEDPIRLHMVTITPMVLSEGVYDNIEFESSDSNPVQPYEDDQGLVISFATVAEAIEGLLEQQPSDL